MLMFAGTVGARKRTGPHRIVLERKGDGIGHPVQVGRGRNS
jgi:hypothetical protein